MGAACVIVDVLAERHPTDAFYVCRLIRLITRKLLFAASNLASFKIIDFYVWRWVDLLNMCTLRQPLDRGAVITVDTTDSRWPTLDICWIMMSVFQSALLTVSLSTA